MVTVEEEFSAVFKEKGSTFLSHLIPYDSFSLTLARLKNDHPKAVHWVSASRHLNAFGQIEESFSDDGEPKGSSGMPMLKVLRGHKLVNVAVISVRYFGGVLLGVGGLVRAYTQSAQCVIEVARILPYLRVEVREVVIPYAFLQRAEYLAEKLHLRLHKDSFLPFEVQGRIMGEAVGIEAFCAQIETKT